MAITASLSFKLDMRGDGAASTYAFNIYQAPLQLVVPTGSTYVSDGWHLGVPSAVADIQYGNSGVPAVTSASIDAFGNVQVVFAAAPSTAPNFLSGRFVF